MFAQYRCWRINNETKNLFCRLKAALADDDDPVDICKDNVFKAVFTRNTPASQGALSKLVSALIGYEVSILTISANEPPIDNLRDRQIRFDINCKAENGELISVEMSFYPSTYMPVRLEFYAGKLFTSQDIKGVDRDYKDLKKAYQIAILDKERFFKNEIFLHTFEFYDPVNHESLDGRIRIITLELAKLDKVVKKPTKEMSIQEQWAIYFKYLTDKSKRRTINEIVEQEEGIAMASDVLITISKEEEERFRLLSQEKIELDYQSGLSHAKKTGIQEGRQEGKQEARQEIIEMLKNGKSPEELIKEFETKTV